MGDNCSYHLRTVFEHTDRSGEFLHTINWLSVPLSKSLYGLTEGIQRGEWKRPDFSRWSIRPLFDPHTNENQILKQASWKAFMRTAAEGGDVCAHPDAPKPERSHVVFEQPVLDAGTAAYRDVDRFLSAVRTMFLFLIGLVTVPWAKAASVVFVVGDQQTYSRMLWLKLYHPRRYDWLLPLGGEFHFREHALMALHRLWWFPIVRWVVFKLGSRKTIFHRWTSIEECKHYDHLYRLIVTTLCMYMAEVVPRALLFSPLQLMRAVRHNKSATVVVCFLYHFALPWLALRQAIRSNNAAVINVMWRLTYHWFAVTGKTNYRIMAVTVTYFVCAMRPELLVVWTLMRTASLCGYAGHNVAWDFVVERFNRMAKQALGQRVSRDRLLYFIPILNAFQWMWPRFERAMHRPESDATDSFRFTQSDIDVMMAAWRYALGSTWEELISANDSSVFTDEGHDDDDGHGGRSGAGRAAPARESMATRVARLIEEGACPWQVMLSEVISVGDEGEEAADEDTEADDTSGMVGGPPEDWEVESIEKVQGKGKDREWLIKWKGHEEKTWEPRKHLEGCAALLQEFERKAKRRRADKDTKPEEESDDEASGDGDRDGDDPEEDYERRITWWYRDVSSILRTKVPEQ